MRAQFFPSLGENFLGEALQSAKWGMLTAILAGIFAVSLPNQYRSESRILPEESNGMGTSGSFAAAAAAFGVGLPGQDGGDANFVDILNSRWLRESLLSSSFHFHERKWLLGKDEEREETLASYLGARNMDLGMGKIGKIFFVTRDPKSKVLIIAAETPSPELSQQMVQKAGSLLEQFVQTKTRTRGGEKAAFAEARLQEARGELESAETAMKRFMDVNRNYLQSGDPSVHLEGDHLGAELRLRQQLVSTLAMNREQSLLDEKNDLPILNVMDPGNLPIEKSRPSRSGIVISFFILGALAALIVRHRAWILARLFQDEASGHKV